MRTDVIVIGSGASGSVMAFELARRGHSVKVLERGARLDPQTFEHSELSSFPRLFKHSGLQVSADHNSLILQGSTVGGSTVINNAIWMRADLDRVLPAWQAAGARVDRAGIEAAYTELEGALHVGRIQPGIANRGASIFERGCEQMGISSEYLENNRSGCLGCGWCNYGCRYNRKTSMLVTYIPWAEQRGVEFIDRCQDVRILAKDGRVTGVEARRDGSRLAIDAERVVVCSGAIGSSEVLLRSDIDLDGRVGAGLHALGGVFVTGQTAHDVDGYDGIGLVCCAHASEDYVIESYFSPPVQFTVRLGGWFLAHFDRAMHYRHFIDGGVMVGTNPRNGRVSLDRRGRVRIDLHLDNRDMDRLRRGVRTMAEIYFAGGAVKVFPASFRFLEFSHPDQLARIEETIREPDDILFGSAHPQGGNPMSEDASRGVVDEQFRVHGYENLYVADTSVWPSNIWANCQATAMAMSHYAATFVAN
jgi:choline dehydrogenase-like flavoprotein